MTDSSPEPDFPFDAVLFDLDGTLVATDRFWVAAADRGCRRALRELGLEREPPDAAGWMGLVGLPLLQGFQALFPDLDPGDLAVVVERCLEAEREALADGGAALLPGAREVLEALRRRGVRTAIASNCGAEYLDAMLGGLGLDALVDQAYCLDTPGIATKADMLARLLEVFGTRSAVMVGDRWTDAEAARANGLPHVHLARGFAPVSERVEADAVLEGLDRLLERLLGRERWIEGALAAAGLLAAGDAAPAPRPRAVGITGGPLAGKTLFARDAARLLRRRGLPARAIEAARFAGAPGPSGEPGPWLVEGEDTAGLPLDFVIRLEVEPATRARREALRGGGPSPVAPRAGRPDPDPGVPGLVLRADNPLGPAPGP